MSSTVPSTPTNYTAPIVFFFNDTATTEIYTLSLHDALPISMRLGAYPCKLRPGSRVAQVYGALEVSERHRHRYEVSNAYRDVLAEYGMRCAGLSPDRKSVV